MRKKDIENLKEQIRRERKEDRRKKQELSNLEPDKEFFNKTAAYIVLELELDIKTIYKLIKIKHMDQMLSTMYESTIKEYKLSEGTIERLRDKELRGKIERYIVKRLGKKMTIQMP